MDAGSEWFVYAGIGRSIDADGIVGWDYWNDRHLLKSCGDVRSTNRAESGLTLTLGAVSSEFASGRSPRSSPSTRPTSDDAKTEGYDTLTQEGLLTRTTAEKKVLIVASKQVNNYDLSEKGRTPWTPDSTQPGYGNFCYDIERSRQSPIRRYTYAVPLGRLEPTGHNLNDSTNIKACGQGKSDGGEIT